MDDVKIAVVGMAGRFPGARNLTEFWDNLAAGVESITQLGPASACGLLEDADCFDAGFFGYAPREALIIDPQHRLFLECAWEALEDAGYDPGRYHGAIGVYAGSSNTEYLNTLRDRRAEIGEVSDFQLRLATGIDFLTTRVAYKFGLRGPAVTVQTACSTSLVAIHLAAQALLNGECDMALAGGVTAHVPLYAGEYTDDGILAADGHCRAFDAEAAGTIGGDGVGVVVLKRLADALSDLDTIQAVILGSAVNNDGNDKIGYTAPSVNGQIAAMRTALALSDVDPSTVTYVEAHGTGTPLGDPIEVAALAQALGAVGSPCWLGSVKTNVGHTDAAAGVAGFIKAVLALRNRHLPASLNFSTPNPRIDFASTRLRVSTSLRPWEEPVLRAAVNSLGIGGTNAFVVLEEAPAAPAGADDPTWQVIPLSARSPAALRDVRRNLAGIDDADAAWTLQIGRRHHPYRQLGSLSDPVKADPDRTVVFAFPGQGGQYPGMARELYDHVPVFREALDECARLFTGPDIRRVLYEDSSSLDTMSVAQATIFSVEYALARTWRSWGVVPDVVLGHSLGAYAAATVAEVLTLPDAAALVAERGRLLQSLPPGAMIAVTLPPEDLLERLGPGLSIAAINGPQRCVVSGPIDDIASLESALEREDVKVRRLHITAAAHSTLVDAVTGRLREFAAGLSMKPPAMPLVSDHTGQWLEGEQAVDPGYWAAHLRGTVRFSQVLTTALGAGDATLVELGPGDTLTTLARQHPAFGSGHAVVTSLPHAAEDESALTHLRRAAGTLWTLGRELDWARLHSSPRRRVPLPTYPFERLRFRLDPVAIEPVGAGEPEVATGPMSATETAVAQAFAAVLGVPPGSARQSFFELGGDSLLATQLAAWARREYSIALSVRDVFQAKTVANLATLIEERQA